MVVNKLWSAAFFIIIFLIGCSEREEKQRGFINRINPEIFERYGKGDELACIKSIPIMSEKDTVFTLIEDSRIHVYAVGEVDFNWMNVPNSYMYKGDAIEYYFDLLCEPLSNPVLIDLFHPDGDSEDTLQYRIGSANFHIFYNSDARKYISKAMIPWKCLSVQPVEQLEINFNLAIGDNDDKIKQKARRVLFGKKDPLLLDKWSFGKIKLLREFPAVHDPGILPCINIEELDYSNSNPPRSVSIENLVFGQINKQEDFSSKISSFWDEDYLYLHVEIMDNFPRAVNPVEIRQASAFLDKGWIEDDSGQVVWEMQNWFAKNAGGARKNQMQDTVISLKAGAYRLKYRTDESHSWGNWDDKPPVTPFYGIAVYKEEN